MQVSVSEEEAEDEADLKDLVNDKDAFKADADTSGDPDAGGPTHPFPLSLFKDRTASSPWVRYVDFPLGHDHRAVASEMYCRRCWRVLICWLCV